MPVPENSPKAPPKWDRESLERPHFRFTWRDFLRWSGIVFLAALAGLAFALYFLDWNHMRGPL